MVIHIYLLLYIYDVFMNSFYSKCIETCIARGCTCGYSLIGNIYGHTCIMSCMSLPYRILNGDVGLYSWTVTLLWLHTFNHSVSSHLFLGIKTSSVVSPQSQHHTCSTLTISCFLQSPAVILVPSGKSLYQPIRMFHVC